jgi:arabinan endo-1,5-alpha-L-arabinosidase
MRSPVVKKRSGQRGARVGPIEKLEPRVLLSSASPVAWFDAGSIGASTGAPVAVWADSSGSGNAASQSTAAKQPYYLPGAINGQAAVHFEGTSSDQLAFSRPVADDFTIMVVFRSTQGISHLQSWYSGAGLVDGEVAGVQNDFGMSLNSFGQVLAGTGNPDTFVASAMGFNDGKPHVATFERTEATGALSLYVDGRLFQQATGGTQPLTAPSRLTIGSLQTNLNYFTGDVGQVRVYGSALTDADRGAVEMQLEQQYAIGPPPTNYFTNPVINADFADPGALQVGRTYYAFATNPAGLASNVQAADSTDLVHWTMLPDALPVLPSWAQTGRTWAPDAALMPDGIHYDMYFTATSRTTGRQAIGVATSTNPAGPYAPLGTAPLVAEFDQGGAIDPSVFTDTTGMQYLLWKNDGNAVGQDTTIYIQQLSSDGLSLLGTRTALIREDQRWEGAIVEAPTLWKHNDKYTLFYSGNNFGGAAYAIGYAQSNALLGPYVKPSQPLVHSEGSVVGPGGEDIVIGPDGNTWMLYHSWDPNFAYRAMSVDRLDWVNNVPVLRGPSRALQPVPVYVQAAPALTVARTDASGTHVSGTLASLPNTHFTLHFFATVSNQTTAVGSTTITTDLSGNARFVDVSLSSVAIGQSITATATDPINETSVSSAPAPVHLTGDLNGDNVVGFADLLLLAQNYGAATGSPAGDVNGDGRVDFTDLLLLAQNYGASGTVLLASPRPLRAVNLSAAHLRI